MKRTLFLVNNSYNLELIKQNCGDLETNVVSFRFRSESFELTNSILPKSTAINIVPKGFGAFHGPAYYKSVNNMLTKVNPSKVVVFLNWHPNNRYIIDWAIQQSVPVELWEEGLNHYLRDFRWKYYFKSLIRILLGQYPKGIFDTNYKVEQLYVRDRFDRRNLHYTIDFMAGNHSCRDGILFVSQPLIEDYYITSSDFYRGLLRLRDEYPNEKLYYLAHPRENLTSDKVLRLRNIGYKLILERTCSAEEYLMKNRFSLVISPFSSTLINLCEFSSCLYVPSYFNLNVIGKRLREKFESFLEVR